MQSIRSTMWNFPKYEHKAKRKEKKRIKDKQHKYEHTKKEEQRQMKWSSAKFLKYVISEKKYIHSLRVKSGGSNVYHTNRDVGAGGQGAVVPPLKRVWV
jgi:hypothetical protein